MDTTPSATVGLTTVQSSDSVERNVQRPSAHIAKQARALCSAVDDIIEHHTAFSPDVPLSTLYQPGDTGQTPPQDRLRRLIPKISVVGQQSAGKSSLLNAILREMGGWGEGCLPVDSDITTLFPTSIFLADSGADALIEGVVPGVGEGSKEQLSPQRVPAEEAQGKIKQLLADANANLAALGAKVEGGNDGRSRREEVMLKGASQYELKVTLSKKDQVDFHLVDLPGIPSGVVGANDVVASLYREHVPSSQVVVLVADARKEFFQDFSWGVVTSAVQNAAVLPKLVVVLNRADSLLPEPDETSLPKLWPQLFQWKAELAKMSNMGIRCSVFLTYAKAANSEDESVAVRKTGVLPVADQLQWQTGISSLTEYMTKEYAALFPKGGDIRSAMAEIFAGITASLDEVGWSSHEAEQRRMRTLEAVRHNIRALSRLDATPAYGSDAVTSPLNWKHIELKEDIARKMDTIVPEWVVDVDAAGEITSDAKPKNPDGSLVLPHSKVEAFARREQINQSHIVKIRGLECHYHVVAQCHATLMAHVRQAADDPLSRLGELVDPLVKALKTSDALLPSGAAPAIRKVKEAVRGAVDACIAKCKSRIENAFQTVESPLDVGVFEHVIDKLIDVCGTESHGDKIWVDVSRLKTVAKERDWMGVEAPKSVEQKLWNDNVVPVLRGVVLAMPGIALEDLQKAATEAASRLTLDDIDAEGSFIADERDLLLAAHKAAESAMAIAR